MVRLLGRDIEWGMCGVRRDCTPRKRALRSKWSKSTLNIKSAEKSNNRNGWPGIKQSKSHKYHYPIPLWFTESKQSKKSWEIKKHCVCPETGESRRRDGAGTGQTRRPSPRGRARLIRRARAARETEKTRDTERRARFSRIRRRGAHMHSGRRDTRGEPRGAAKKRGRGRSDDLDLRSGDSGL